MAWRSGGRGRRQTVPALVVRSVSQAASVRALVADRHGRVDAAAAFARSFARSFAAGALFRAFLVSFLRLSGQQRRQGCIVAGEPLGDRVVEAVKVILGPAS